MFWTYQWFLLNLRTIWLKQNLNIRAMGQISIDYIFNTSYITSKVFYKKVKIKFKIINISI